MIFMRHNRPLWAHTKFFREKNNNTRNKANEPYITVNIFINFYKYSIIFIQTVSSTMTCVFYVRKYSRPKKLFYRAQYFILYHVFHHGTLHHFSQRNEPSISHAWEFFNLICMKYFDNCFQFHVSPKRWSSTCRLNANMHPFECVSN